MRAFNRCHGISAGHTWAGLTCHTTEVSTRRHMLLVQLKSPRVHGKPVRIRRCRATVSGERLAISH